MTNVECDEVSTYKIGSRGRLGAQAIVNQRLTLKQQSAATQSVPSFGNLNILSIKLTKEK